MNRPDFLVVGHVTKDLYPGGHRLGGSASYSALTAANLGRKVALLTSAGPDLELSDAFRGIDVRVLSSTATTTFENRYQGEKQVQFLRAVAGVIRARDLPPSWYGVPIVHIAPVAQEVDPSLISSLRSPLIGVTPQGWMRRWKEDGWVESVPWEAAEQLLPHIQVVVLSEADLPQDEGLIDAYAQRVLILVVTLGERGSRVHSRQGWRWVPPFPARVVDPTGAGDVFAAAFLINFAKTGDAFLAARYASCAASFALEQEGTAGLPGLAKIEERLRIWGEP